MRNISSRGNLQAWNVNIRKNVENYDRKEVINKMPSKVTYK